MGIQILDGTGGGSLAQVTTEGHLVIDAFALEEIAHISNEHGQAFTWSSGTYDGAAADTVLLVKNTSSVRKLFIQSIWMSSDVETRVVIHVPTSEVTPTGTAVTGRNMNITSGNVAEATAIRDETNNTQGNIYWSGEIPILSTPYEVRLHSALILGQNDSLGVDYVADAAACDVVIMGYFE